MVRNSYTSSWQILPVSDISLVIQPLPVLLHIWVFETGKNKRSLTDDI